MTTKEHWIESSGVKLHALSEIPDNAKAVIVMVHGSFVQTKDGDLDGSVKWMFPEGTPKRNLFKDIAGFLNKNGYGTLRYDKRASGKSRGMFEDTDLDLIAKDVISVVRYAKKEYGLPVGILGQSEGGLTTVLAQTKGANADFLIIQGGMLRELNPILEWQKKHAAKVFLEDKTGDMARKMPYYTALYKALFSDEDFKKALKNPEKKHYTLKLNKWSGKMNLDLIRQHYKYNPSEMLKSIKCPVIVIQGDKDANIPVSIAEDLLKAQDQGEYKNLSIHILKDHDHSFRKQVKGLDFLEMMKQPISDEYLNLLSAEIICRS